MQTMSLTVTGCSATYSTSRVSVSSSGNGTNYYFTDKVKYKKLTFDIKAIAVNKGKC